MCEQVAFGDTRCGRSYVGQELAVVVVSNTEVAQVGNLRSFPGTKNQYPRVGILSIYDILM